MQARLKYLDTGCSETRPDDFIHSPNFSPYLKSAGSMIFRETIAARSTVQPSGLFLFDGQYLVNLPAVVHVGSSMSV